MRIAFDQYHFKRVDLSRHITDRNRTFLSTVGIHTRPSKKAMMDEKMKLILGERKAWYRKICKKRKWIAQARRMQIFIRQIKKIIEDEDEENGGIWSELDKCELTKDRNKYFLVSNWSPLTLFQRKVNVYRKFKFTYYRCVTDYNFTLAGLNWN